MQGDGRGFGGGAGRQDPAEPLTVVAEELDDHVFLGPEVAEERAAGDAAGGGQLVDGGLFEALDGEQPQRGLGQLVADELALRSARLTQAFSVR